MEFAEKAGDSIKVNDLTYDIEYLNGFLPQLKGEEETLNIITNIINVNKFTSKDFGKIMGLLKKDYNNQIDFNLASQIIKNTLNE